MYGRRSLPALAALCALVLGSGSAPGLADAVEPARQAQSGYVRVCNKGLYVVDFLVSWRTSSGQVTYGGPSSNITWQACGELTRRDGVPVGIIVRYWDQGGWHVLREAQGDSGPNRCFETGGWIFSRSSAEVPC